MTRISKMPPVTSLKQLNTKRKVRIERISPNFDMVFIFRLSRVFCGIWPEPVGVRVLSERCLDPADRWLWLFLCHSVLFFFMEVSCSSKTQQQVNTQGLKPWTCRTVAVIHYLRLFIYFLTLDLFTYFIEFFEFWFCVSASPCSAVYICHSECLQP